MSKSSRGTVFGLIVVTLIALPGLCAANEGQKPAPADDGAPTKPAANANPDEALAKGTKSFELRVVGPEGKPVPTAMLEVRTSPRLAAEQIMRGKFVREEAFGVVATTDGEGVIVIGLPEAQKSLIVFIMTPGFGPYRAGWSSKQKESVPARFTAELDSAWTVGGIVVDEEGSPIEGVKIYPNVQFDKRMAVLSRLSFGTTLTTDAIGQWRFESVPESMSDVFVEINHPAYERSSSSLSRAGFGIERGHAPTAKIVLRRGLTVTGKVTDDAGNPIAGALVRTKFLNDIRETKTGDDGVYRLGGCEPKLARIVVSAKGKATDMQEVRIDPEMEPVNFQMRPGGKIRIRVLDMEGKPVPKARIFFQHWRGERFKYFEFDHVNEYADQEGVWEWNEAPLDEFRADICPPNGMALSRQPLIAREEEYVFRTPPALVVSGRAIDAETGQPIEKFQVIRGIRSSDSHMTWVDSRPIIGVNGAYSYRLQHDYFANLFRAEADGYQPIISRVVKSDEGSVTIDFEMIRGKNIVAKVISADLKPAAGAKVALGIAGSQISVSNGDIDDSSTYSARTTADDAGRFHFPPQKADFQLVITHPSGYAHIKATPDWPTVRIIRLEPWARVEGTFRVGAKPVGNVPITINTEGLHTYGEKVPRIFAHHDVTAGPDGRFVFERVVPGHARIGRRLIQTFENGAIDVTSSTMQSADFLPAETAHIDLGGTGRPVVGRLNPPVGHDGKVLWNFAIVRVAARAPAMPIPNAPPLPAEIQADPEKRAAWLQNWQETTEEGRAWKAARGEVVRIRDARPDITASVARDGSFRIDDLPAGDYLLSVSFVQNEAALLVAHVFTVPEMPGGRSDEPLDLGVLTLRGK